MTGADIDGIRLAHQTNSSTMDPMGILKSLKSVKLIVLIVLMGYNNHMFVKILKSQFLDGSTNKKEPSVSPVGVQFQGRIIPWLSQFLVGWIPASPTKKNKNICTPK